MEKYKITELIMVKANWNKTFIGAMTQNKDTEGNISYGGSVIIEEGKIVSSGVSADELRTKLDEMCKLKLENNLHNLKGSSMEIFGVDTYMS